MELLFWITAFFASVLGTIVAFGISSILLPVALYFYNYQTALMLVSLFHISGNIGRISFFSRKPDRKMILIFGFPAVLSTFIGANLVGLVDESILRATVGLILAFYSVLGLFKYEIKIKSNIVNSLIGGSVYGFLSGLIGTGGPLRGAILLGFGLDSELYIATSGLISLMIDLARIPIYLWKGFLLPQYYNYVPYLLVVALSGSYVSKRIVEKISVEKFTNIVRVSILLVSLKLVYEGLSALL